MAVTVKLGQRLVIAGAVRILAADRDVVMAPDDRGKIASGNDIRAFA
jgi:hypothetical protein